MTPEIQILSTKKITELQRSLLKHSLKLIDVDFINIENIPIEAEKQNCFSNAVIFTSQNAVKSLLSSFSRNQLNFNTIFCVGNKTKLLLEENNFKVSHVEQYGSDLADFIISQNNISEVTFFCGEIRLDEIPNKLAANAIKVNEIKVYKTVINKVTMPETFAGILFFSPSGVHSYIQSNNSIKPKAFCIGNTTAQEASNYFKEVIVSDKPTVEDVINKVNQYYV